MLCMFVALAARILLSFKMAAPKEYGLIKRGPKDQVIQPRLSIFDDDSDEDVRASVGRSLKKEADKVKSKKQVKLNIQNALSEDPTVFEYDEVYDDMVQKKKDEIGLQKKKTEKKSRYIESLLKAAKSRNLEQERAYERKVQKERIAEGEQFAGKEAFVTSAYKKKMLEMQEQEEKERREAQIEALTDVTKQTDLSGFYRHLYRQTLDPKPEMTDEMKSDDKDSDSESSRARERASFSAKPCSSKGERKRRQFRRRRESSSSSDSDEQGEAMEAVVRARSKSNDSRTSSNGNSSQLDLAKDDGTTQRSTRRESVESSSSSQGGQNITAKRARSDSSESLKDESTSQRDRRRSSKDKGKENRARKRSDNEIGSKTEVKPEISARERLLALFKKRNIGEAFEKARERYFARRAARNAMLSAFS